MATFAAAPRSFFPLPLRLPSCLHFRPTLSGLVNIGKWYHRQVCQLFHIISLSPGLLENQWETLVSLRTASVMKSEEYQTVATIAMPAWNQKMFTGLMQGRAKALINLHRRFASSQSVIVKKRSKRIEKAQIVCALHVPGPPPTPMVWSPLLVLLVLLVLVLLVLLVLVLRSTIHTYYYVVTYPHTYT